MMFFIPWVLLFLGVIVAVPVAAMMEKRKRAASSPGSYVDDDMDEPYEEEGEVEAFSEDAPMEVAEDGEAVFEDVAEVDDDEFSAFE